MLIVAIIGLIVNLVGLRLLKGTHKHAEHKHAEHTFSESTQEYNNLGMTDALHIQGAKLNYLVIFLDLLQLSLELFSYIILIII